MLPSLNHRLRRLGRSVLAAASALAIALSASGARANVSEAAPHRDEAFDFMNLLAQEGLHDLKNETWNAYGQFTFIASYKPPFHAAYTDLNGSHNSLSPNAELSFTGSFTLWLAAHLWRGGEAYFVPEVISLQALSDLRGLGGAIQNFELQKTGTRTPQLYRSRAFIQQRIELGGDTVEKTSDPMQLGAVTTSRRLVIRIGNFSTIDFMDKNAFAGDLRQQFLNMAFLTYAAYDFMADARGYSWGGMAELVWDRWALRVGRMAPPKDPNTLPLDLHLQKVYGDQVEIEHTHQWFGLDGAVRVLAYRNHAVTGRFDDAIAAHAANPMKNAANCEHNDLYNYGSQNALAPDLCWARKPNDKVGIGLNFEQHLTEDMGVFLRAMVSDGQSEVYAFGSSDRSLSFGIEGKGSLWNRPLDVAGVGAGLGWISSIHADYLRLGGVDGFVGDGTLTRGVESVLEAFYSVNLASMLWVSADFQHITNPGFNRDRGPVEVIGGRLHAEF